MMAAAMLTATAAWGQSDTITSDKVITNAKMIGIGATNILDTYLSPEKYRGTELRYISHTTRDSESSRWSRQIVHQGDIAYTDNRSGNGTEISGAYNFRYGWLYNWHFLDRRLNVKAGAAIDATIGFIYNTRNGNNPAQARAMLNITPTGTTVSPSPEALSPHAMKWECRSAD